MSTTPSQPPWGFLLSASVFSLQSYELSRLNLSANLRTDMTRLLDQWVEESASALLARWLIEQRQRRSGHACEVCGAPQERAAAGVASDNISSEGVIPRPPL